MESVQQSFQLADTKNATEQKPVCHCEFFTHFGMTVISESRWIEYVTDTIRFFNDAKFINNIYTIQSYIRYEYRMDNGRWKTIFECDTMFLRQANNTLMKLTYYGHFNEENVFIMSGKTVFIGPPKKTLVQIMRQFKLLPKQHLPD